MTAALIVLSAAALGCIALIVNGLRSLDRLDDALADFDTHADEALAVVDEPVPYLPVFTAAEIDALRALAAADGRQVADVRRLGGAA